MTDFSYIIDPEIRKQCEEREERQKRRTEMELSKINSNLALNDMIMLAIVDLGGAEWFSLMGQLYPKEFLTFVASLVKSNSNAKSLNGVIDSKSGFNFQMILNKDD